MFSNLKNPNYWGLETCRKSLRIKNVEIFQANYVEQAATVDDDKDGDDKKDDAERKVKHETVVVTEVTDDAHIYAQHVDEGPKLVGLMNQLREEFTQNPPLAGSYTPRRGKDSLDPSCLMMLNKCMASSS